MASKILPEAPEANEIRAQQSNELKQSEALHNRVNLNLQKKASQDIEACQQQIEALKQKLSADLHEEKTIHQRRQKTIIAHHEQRIRDFEILSQLQDSEEDSNFFVSPGDQVIKTISSKPSKDVNLHLESQRTSATKGNVRPDDKQPHTPPSSRCQFKDSTQDKEEIFCLGLSAIASNIQSHKFPDPGIIYLGANREEFHILNNQGNALEDDIFTSRIPSDVFGSVTSCDSSVKVLVQCCQNDETSISWLVLSFTTISSRDTFLDAVNDLQKTVEAYVTTKEQLQSAIGSLFPNMQKKPGSINVSTEQSHKTRTYRRGSTDSSAAFEVENGIYTKPSCMNGVPEAKLIENDSKYWVQTWQTYAELMDKARESLQVLVSEKDELEADIEFDAEQDKNVARRITKAERVIQRNQDCINYFENVCSIHPNQLMSKEFMKETGLVQRDYIQKLVSILQTLDKNETEQSSVQWLRVRLAQICADNERNGQTFVLKQVLQNFYNDPKFRKIKQNAGQKERQQERDTKQDDKEHDTNASALGRCSPDSSRTFEYEGNMSDSVIIITTRNQIATKRDRSTSPPVVRKRARSSGLGPSAFSIEESPKGRHAPSALVRRENVVPKRKESFKNDVTNLLLGVSPISGRVKLIPESKQATWQYGSHLAVKTPSPTKPSPKNASPSKIKGNGFMDHIRRLAVRDRADATIAQEMVQMTTPRLRYESRPQNLNDRLTPRLLSEFGEPFEVVVIKRGKNLKKSTDTHAYSYRLELATGILELFQNDIALGSLSADLVVNPKKVDEQAYSQRAVVLKTFTVIIIVEKEKAPRMEITFKYKDDADRFAALLRKHNPKITMGLRDNWRLDEVLWMSSSTADKELKGGFGVFCRSWRPVIIFRHERRQRRQHVEGGHVADDGQPIPTIQLDHMLKNKWDLLSADERRKYEDIANSGPRKRL